MAAKKPAAAPKSSRKTVPSAAAHDPTSDDALRALPAKFASPPDMPIEVAIREWTGLANQAKALAKAFGAIGLGADTIGLMGGFAKRLAANEKRWQVARTGVAISAKERKLLAEAEALDSKLLAGGRWALRHDEDAQRELSRIAEGSGLRDTVDDLRDLGDFWKANREALSQTRITEADLKRAAELAETLAPAAEKEAGDLDAAAALELRNRTFWAGDRLAKDIREGGRYAFNDQPKLASKFVSRYRSTQQKKSRKKGKGEGGTESKEPAPA